jgi:hypothetical protein
MRVHISTPIIPCPDPPGRAERNRYRFPYRASKKRTNPFVLPATGRAARGRGIHAMLSHWKEKLLLHLSGGI